MKTKTIEVWVDTLFNNSKHAHGTISKHPTIPNKYKAKLIIEIPAEKITITEDELRKKMDKQFAGGYFAKDTDKLMSELFKK